MSILNFIADMRGCDLKKTYLGYELIPKYIPEGVIIMTYEEQIKVEETKIEEARANISEIISIHRKEINEYLRGFKVGDRVSLYKEPINKRTGLKVIGIIQTISTSDDRFYDDNCPAYIEEIKKMIKDKDHSLRGIVRVFVVIPDNITAQLDDIACDYKDTHDIVKV